MQYTQADIKKMVESQGCFFRGRRGVVPISYVFSLSGFMEKLGGFVESFGNKLHNDLDYEVLFPQEFLGNDTISKLFSNHQVNNAHEGIALESAIHILEELGDGQKLECHEDELLVGIPYSIKTVNTKYFIMCEHQNRTQVNFNYRGFDASSCKECTQEQVNERYMRLTAMVMDFMIDVLRIRQDTFVEYDIENLKNKYNGLAAMHGLTAQKTTLPRLTFARSFIERYSKKKRN